MKKKGRAVPALRNGQTSLSNELPAFIQIIEESNKSQKLLKKEEEEDDETKKCCV